MFYGFLRSYVAQCLVSIVPPLLRGKGGAEGTKGGKAAVRRLITVKYVLLMNQWCQAEISL